MAKKPEKKEECDASDEVKQQEEVSLFPWESETVLVDVANVCGVCLQKGVKGEQELSYDSLVLLSSPLAVETTVSWKKDGGRPLADLFDASKQSMSPRPGWLVDIISKAAKGGDQSAEQAAEEIQTIFRNGDLPGDRYRGSYLGDCSVDGDIVTTPAVARIENPWCSVSGGDLLKVPAYGLKQWINCPCSFPHVDADVEYGVSKMSVELPFGAPIGLELVKMSVKTLPIAATSVASPKKMELIHQAIEAEEMGISVPPLPPVEGEFVVVKSRRKVPFMSSLSTADRTYLEKIFNAPFGLRDSDVPKKLRKMVKESQELESPPTMAQIVSGFCLDTTCHETVALPDKIEARLRAEFTLNADQPLPGWVVKTLLRSPSQISGANQILDGRLTLASFEEKIGAGFFLSPPPNPVGQAKAVGVWSMIEGKGRPPPKFVKFFEKKKQAIPALLDAGLLHANTFHLLDNKGRTAAAIVSFSNHLSTAVSGICSKELKEHGAFKVNSPILKKWVIRCLKSKVNNQEVLLRISRGTLDAKSANTFLRESTKPPPGRPNKTTKPSGNVAGKPKPGKKSYKDAVVDSRGERGRSKDPRSNRKAREGEPPKRGGNEDALGLLRGIISLMGAFGPRRGSEPEGLGGLLGLLSGNL